MPPDFRTMEGCSFLAFGCTTQAVPGEFAASHPLGMRVEYRARRLRGLVSVRGRGLGRGGWGQVRLKREFMDESTRTARASHPRADPGVPALSGDQWCALSPPLAFVPGAPDGIHSGERDDQSPLAVERTHVPDDAGLGSKVMTSHVRMAHKPELGPPDNDSRNSQPSPEEV